MIDSDVDIDRLTTNFIKKVDHSLKKEAIAPEIKAVVESARNYESTVSIPKFYLAITGGIFVLTNVACAVLIYFSFTYDIKFLESGVYKSSAERLINSKIILAIIGGTILQVGAAFIAIINIYGKAMSSNNKEVKK